MSRTGDWTLYADFMTKMTSVSAAARHYNLPELGDRSGRAAVCVIKPAAPGPG